MADIAFGSVLNVIKLALKIQKQVKTVRQNEEECQDIEHKVGTLIEILSPLQQNPEVVMSQLGINAALLSLEMTLNRALSLIKDCQESNAMRRLFGAADMSKKLRRIRADILEEMVMLLVATSAVQVTITMTNTIQLQDAGPAEVAYTNNFTAHDARSRVSNEITMLGMGSNILDAPSSRLTKLTLSMSKATIHHISEESVSIGGGRSIRKMKKIVINISLPSPKMKSRAIRLGASMAGVRSVCIIGDRDQLEVIGEGLDAVCLLRCLRKKLRPADMIPVVAARDMKKPEDHKVGARKSNKGWTMAFQATWRQLCRRNKAGTTTAAEKGQGRVSFVGARGRSRSTMDDIAEQAAVLPMLPSGPSSSLPSIRQETPMLSRRRTTATTPSMTASRSVTSSAARTGMAHGKGVDAVCLLSCIRKKLGYANIIQVEEVRDMKKPEETKVGASKSKKGWAMAFQATWRQLCRRNKAGATTAAEKGQGRASFVGGRGSRSSMDIAEQAIQPMLHSGPSSSLPSIRQETAVLSRSRTTATTPSMTAASRSATSSAARTGMAHGKGKQPLLCEDNDDSDSHNDNSEDRAYEPRMSQMPGAPLYSQSQSQTTPGAGPSTSRHEPKTSVKTMQGCCLVKPRKWVTVMNRLPVLSVTVGIISAICLVCLIVFSLFITSFG